MAGKAKPVSTNITEDHRASFNALSSGEYNNFALFSCFVNGEPSSAIVAITEDENGGFIVKPLFVAVTPGMKLVDHEGKAA